MNYDLAKLTDVQLLEIFNAVVAQEGPITVSGLSDIAELDAEMERRIAQNQLAFEQAVCVEANEIQERFYRAGGRA